MSFSRAGKHLFVPCAIVGSILCAFPFLVVLPANWIYTQITGATDLFLARGFLSWAVIAGALSAICVLRCAYLFIRVRPLQREHVLFLTVSFFMIVSYTLVFLEPLRRGGFFLARMP
jgi:hypothetical protein